jgi:hypothetical protein
MSLVKGARTASGQDCTLSDAWWEYALFAADTRRISLDIRPNRITQ